jgi:hypothetical protein
MKLQQISLVSCLILGLTGFSEAQSFWPVPRKKPIHVRLIAVQIAFPRTSFFANDEVLIAEQVLAKNESRFVKLVYDFLPYQNPLSSFGLSYSLVHRVQAIRDATCDEALWEMRKEVRKSDSGTPQFIYAPDSPIDLERRQARLRCYRVTSDGYETAAWHPTNEVPY